MISYLKLGKTKNNEGTLKNAKFKRELTGWGFIAVPMIIIALFSFYPMFQALILSFHAGTGTNLNFVGLDNYARLLQDANFITAVKNTYIFLLIQVPIMILLGLIMAVILNNKDLKGSGFFRTAIFLPCVTSLVAYSTVFRLLFSHNGLINAMLMNASIISEPIGWLSTPFWARAVVIIAITWRWTGFNMMFYLAGLQNIDHSMYEAARIDGASVFQQFTKITVPLLKPIILFTSITSTIGTLQLFDEVFTLTGGGPGNATITISQLIFMHAFERATNFGYAVTISFSIVVMVVILSFIQFKVVGDRK